MIYLNGHPVTITAVTPDGKTVMVKAPCNKPSKEKKIRARYAKTMCDTSKLTCDREEEISEVIQVLQGRT